MTSADSEASYESDTTTSESNWQTCEIPQAVMKALFCGTEIYEVYVFPMPAG